MMITCPECSRACSNKASCCPQCGNPIAQPYTTLRGEPRYVQPVELTGKRFKLGGVLAMCLVLGGCVGCFAVPVEDDATRLACTLACIAGIALSILFKITGWWHHG